jgi:hypothetical protein
MELKSLFNRKTVLRQTASLFLLGAAAIAFQGAVAGTAYAHTLTITASASCVNGAPVISYTVTSWDRIDFGGSNNEIDILVNNVKLTSGMFTVANTNQFSGTVAAPNGFAGTTVTVEALAAVAWVDLFPSGQTSRVSVAIPATCASTFLGCTVTQGGWGAPPHGNNPGAFLVAHFGPAYPLGVTIGGVPFSLRFESAASVRAFLPQGGPPEPLNTSAVNPTARTSAGVFAGQVLALELNVDLYHLGSLTLSGTGTPFDGQTVSAVLAAANLALAGGPLPPGFASYSALNDLIDNLNGSFDGCVRDGWASTHLH